MDYGLSAHTLLENHIHLKEIPISIKQAQITESFARHLCSFYQVAWFQNIQILSNLTILGQK